jgi:aryl-alcohol dehydrogenase-like predicted oxidoreductase
LILSPFAITEPTPSAPSAPAPGSTRQLAVLARQPLAGRALAGTLGPGVKLAQRDDRALDLPTLERLALAAARLAPLVRSTPPAANATQAARDALANGKRPESVNAFTLAELALRYVIDRGAIALPRLHRHEHVPDALMAASAEPLTPEIVRILDGIS